MSEDSSEQAMFEVLEDLEAHAETLHHLERAAEVADRSRAEYQAVLLEGRLMSSVGHEVVLGLRGVGPVRGQLRRVGDQWCQVTAAQVRWTVRSSALLWAQGLSERALPRLAWSRIDTVALGSPLRRIADDRLECTVHLVDGSALQGVLRRVGGDFVELGEGSDGVTLVALEAVAAVRTEDRSGVV